MYTTRCRHCGRINRLPAAADGSPVCGSCRLPLPWMVDAGDSDFAEIAERPSIPVVVDMWAPWCGPCRMVTPALEQLATEHAGEVKLVKVDVDRAPALARRFSVQAVPTLLILDHGKVIAARSGAVPIDALRTWLSHALAQRTASVPNEKQEAS